MLDCSTWQAVLECLLSAFPCFPLLSESLCASLVGQLRNGSRPVPGQSVMFHDVRFWLCDLSDAPEVVRVHLLGFMANALQRPQPNSNAVKSDSAALGLSR